MIEIHKFIANDGKEFYSYDECADYENENFFKSISDNFKVWDANFKEFYPKNDDNFNSAFYLFVKDAETVKKVKSFSHDFFAYNKTLDRLLSDFDKYGHYFYFDNDIDDWESLTVLKEKYESIKSDFQAKFELIKSNL